MDGLIQHLEASGLNPIVIDENTDVGAEVQKRMRRMTNAQFIDEIMTFCPYGAIGQILVMQAVQQFAEQVANASLEELEHPLINAEAYKLTGEWIVQRFKEQYGE